MLRDTKEVSLKNISEDSSVVLNAVGLHSCKIDTLGIQQVDRRCSAIVYFLSL
jgi:hypothetical protein